MRAQTLFLLATSLVPLPAADTLSQVLARIDSAGASFRSMTAQLKRVSHTAVINEDNTDTGTMRLKRVGPRDTRMRVDFTQPDPKTVTLDGNTFDIYLPKIKTVQEYDVGKNRALLDQFLLLGFGASSKELLKAYEITLVGPETINGEPAQHLSLIPKSKEVLQHLKQVDLWISDRTGYPVQQKLFFPGGDYMLVTYSDLKVNPSLRDSDLKLKLPSGVKYERPQK
jgi:outer membrane lipoprotein carrier protein